MPLPLPCLFAFDRSETTPISRYRPISMHLHSQSQGAGAAWRHADVPSAVGPEYSRYSRQTIKSSATGYLPANLHTYPALDSCLDRRQAAPPSPTHNPNHGLLALCVDVEDEAGWPRVCRRLHPDAGAARPPLVLEHAPAPAPAATAAGPAGVDGGHAAGKGTRREAAPGTEALEIACFVAQRTHNVQKKTAVYVLRDPPLAPPQK